MPFNPEAIREIISQGMTDDEYRNAQEPIEEVFDEQEDRACGCCGPSLVGAGGVKEQIKWHDAWQVMHNLHKLQDCGESKYEPSVVLTRGHEKKGPIMFVSVPPSLAFALLYRKRNKHILIPRMRRALNNGKIIFMVST